MKKFLYPDITAGEKLIREFGGDPSEALQCQDWEYTYPIPEDLDKYMERYKEAKTTDEEKRVLASFIFEVCEDILRENYAKNEKRVSKILKLLYKDLNVNQYVFNYWSSWETEEKEHRWFIAEIVREFNVKLID